MSKILNKPGFRSPRTSEERARLRAQGLRPVQHWVPDLRDPQILAQLRDEGARLSQHPGNDVIDAWLDEVRDLDGWR
ncbi:antitoxin MazE family protein [Tardiphaga sp.]|jgi:hypothetical protein|uniref:antitoxin MazE family protein n=1 Tax=Tardiphaga sp. TaxID=1926292 RepID=UPI0037DA6C22